MSESRALLLVCVGIGIAALVSGWGKTWPEAEIDPTNPAKIVIGKEIYAEHCAACHGMELEGQPDWRVRLESGRLPAPPHDETGHTWHHSDEELFMMTRNGIVPPLAPEGYESDMPAFEGILTDDEIRAVLAYILSTWPPETVAMRKQILERPR